MMANTKMLLIISIILTLLNYIFLYENGKTAPSEHKNTNNTKVERSVQRALVILDDWNNVESHSLFWEQIRKASYVIEFKMVDDINIKLDFYGEKLYDTIILFVPSFTDDQAKNSELSIKKILDHFDNGHNLMIIADKNVHSYLRNLVTEFGVDFDDYNSQVKDSLYMHSLKESLQQDLLKMRNNEIVVTKDVVPVKNVFHNPSGYILYEGIGLDVDPHNQYLFSILKADENSYSVNSESGLYYNFGDKIKLVTGYQGRNNKRVTITGSASLCSNKFYYLSDFENAGPQNSPNAIFCNDLINWNFQRTGVLKYENVRHHRKSDGKTLDIYRIKDELVYMVDIYEYDFVSDSWKPYLTDDLQIEYSMMDPFYRLQLKMLSMGSPTYMSTFKVRFYNFRHLTNGEFSNLLLIIKE